MQRPSYVDSLKIQNNDFEVLSDEEIFKKIKTDTESALSANSLLVFSLLGLIVLSLTYSIFITIIFRKILLRDYYN
jgi:flagellar biosynthesis/type III secretory pathway M-ring protein FliF/YscJ